ncbi:MAG TPA: FAD binding domain-containing protein [Acidimicrobiales bacterium]|nr:FAD binding domain-containing protein [Acidimicrobiales bacterium]
MLRTAMYDELTGLAPEGSVRFHERLYAHRLRIGASVTLQALVEDEHVPAVIRQAARRDQLPELRRLATVGDCVSAADFDSELLATLLAYDASATIHDRHGWRTMPLVQVLDEDAFVRCTAAALTIETDGVAFSARVGRAPGERPIVAAVARRRPNGEVRVALSGVATVPVVIGRTEALDPRGDGRASSEYRRILAAALMDRALDAV